MVIKATLEYEDGSSAIFTGSPLDLNTLPTDSGANTEIPAEPQPEAPAA